VLSEEGWRREVRVNAVGATGQSPVKKLHE
jgi:hypothetical protein